MINRLIVVIILAAGVSLVMGYAYTTFAYFPKLAHDRGLSQSLVGLTIGLNSLPFMIFSIASPFLMKKFGRKAYLTVSQLSLTVAVFIFATLDFVKNKQVFLTLSVLSRLIVGAGMSSYTTAAYSYTTILYKDNIQKGIGRIQAGIGIGPIVCLLTSAFIFKWFGFFVTFAVISAWMLIVTLIIVIFVPDIKDDTEQDQEETPKSMTYKSWHIFRDLRIIGCIVGAGLAMLLIDAPSALVADRFGELKLPEYLKGLTFLFSNVPFTFTSLILHRFTKISHRKIIIWFGWIFLAIGFLLIGPSGLFHFPERVWLILFGFSFFGISYASLIVTNIPLMQEYASQYEIKDDNMSETKKNQQEYDYKTTTGYISGAFNLSFGLGTMLGPLISPRISDGIGYRGFTDLFSGLAIASLLIFITFNLLHLCQNPKQLRKKRDTLEKSVNTSENLSKLEEDIDNQESLLKSYDTSNFSS